MTHKSIAVADNRVMLSDMERAQKLIANATGLQPTFDGTGSATLIVSQIDFVTVNDNIGPSQT